MKAATSEFEKLQRVFPDFRLGLLHGRLKPAEKLEVLEKFRSGDIQVLVTTPVVEVGIDVPNATVMLIEGSDRFGLGQLHQLRGRVGRGSLQSYCLLFSETTDEHAIQRLKALEKTYSGPLLAELDLTLRGPGELFGTRQHGASDLKIASYTDAPLIQATKEALDSLTGTDPDLTRYPHLRDWAKKSTIEPIVND
jgi:ATP-dependent DNA helicase RecG